MAIGSIALATILAPALLLSTAIGQPAEIDPGRIIELPAIYERVESVSSLDLPSFLASSGGAAVVVLHPNALSGIEVSTLVSVDPPVYTEDQTISGTYQVELVIPPNARVLRQGSYRWPGDAPMPGVPAFQQISLRFPFVINNIAQSPTILCHLNQAARSRDLFTFVRSINDRWSNELLPAAQMFASKPMYDKKPLTEEYMVSAQQLVGNRNPWIALTGLQAMVRLHLLNAAMLDKADGSSGTEYLADAVAIASYGGFFNSPEGKDWLNRRINGSRSLDQLTGIAVGLTASWDVMWQMSAYDAPPYAFFQRALLDDGDRGAVAAIFSDRDAIRVWMSDIYTLASQTPNTAPDRQTDFHAIDEGCRDFGLYH